MIEPDVATLTANQAARRRRVIDAAMELATDGGYDAVQMRDVVSEAGVALGTIYRYFASKDHLLAACQVEWAREIERQLQQRPARGDTCADRVVEVLRRATRSTERRPQLTAALVTAISSSDPAVSGCQREMTEVMAGVLSAPMDDLDPELKDGVIRGALARLVLVAARMGQRVVHGGSRRRRARVGSAGCCCAAPNSKTRRTRPAPATSARRAVQLERSAVPWGIASIGGIGAATRDRRFGSRLEPVLDWWHRDQGEPKRGHRARVRPLVHRRRVGGAVRQGHHRRHLPPLRGGRRAGARGHRGRRRQGGRRRPHGLRHRRLAPPRARGAHRRRPEVQRDLRGPDPRHGRRSSPRRWARRSRSRTWRSRRRRG